MAQTPQETQATDPITESFARDRQAFWTRFTGFSTNAVIAIVILLVLLWLFVA